MSEIAIWTKPLARRTLLRARGAAVCVHELTVYGQGADADLARTRALAAYKDFLSLWKDANPHTPTLREAKAEYAKLQ